MTPTSEESAPSSPFQSIANFLLSRLPESCVRGVLKVQMTRSNSQGVYNAYQADGSVVHLKINLEAWGYLHALRASMYDPVTGTWYSAEFTATRDTASLDATFDYTSEPDWHQSINPAIYRDDLTEFPRDDHNMPDWLVRDVAAAEAGVTVVGGHMTPPVS